jgi:hypothetical protein
MERNKTEYYQIQEFGYNPAAQKHLGTCPTLKMKLCR